jgi:hypothetical protein
LRINFTNNLRFLPSLLLLQGLSFANVYAQPIGVLHSAFKLTETGSYSQYPQGSSVLKGYASIEEESKLEDESLHLISVESFDPRLILSGDSLIFKATPEVGEIFKIPANTYLKASVEGDSIDNRNFLFRVTELISENGSSTAASGLFKIDTKEQDKSLEDKISEDAFLRTSSNIVLGSLGGTLKTLKYGGLPLIMLTDGFSVVAGAGLGAVSGIVNSFVAAPQPFYSEPSDSQLKVKFIEPIKADLYSFGKSTAQLPEPLLARDINLEVKITQSKKFYSYNFGDSIFLELKIENASEKDFDLQDFILVDKTNSQEFLPNPFLFNFNSEELSEINSDTTRTLKLCYSLGKFSDLDNYNLRILDPVTAKHLYYVPIQI